MDLLIRWLETHPGTAGWVQAFGALIGLAVAIYLPYQQHVQALKQARYQRHERSLQLFDALGAMANFAGQCFLDLRNAMNSADYLEELPYAYQPSELDGMASTFSSFPLHELPDHDSVRCALLIRSSFSHLCNELAKAYVALTSGDSGTYLEHKEVYELHYFEFTEHVLTFSEQAQSYRQRLFKNLSE